MSILSPKVAIALKNAKLPTGVNRFTVPWKAIPASELERIDAWRQVSGLKTQIDATESWWSISESEAYGRTLWGPYVAQMPGDPDVPALILGYESVPLSDLQNFSVQADEDGGFYLEWAVNLGGSPDYVTVPIRKNKTTNPSLKEIRACLVNGTPAKQALAEAIIQYPKLPSLAVGSYKVLGSFQYQGYNGRDWGLVIEIDGSPHYYRGNRETSATLALGPEISVENPATLHILSHGTTAQGHAKVAVRFEVDFGPQVSSSFNFDAAPQPALTSALPPASDEGLVVDLTDSAVSQPVLAKKAKKN